MKSIFKFFVICFLSMVLLSCSSSNDTIQDTKGNIINKNAFNGKWIIINYWATWCENCIHEIPELNRFSQLGNKSLAMYGVNFDGLAGDSLKEGAKSLGIGFPVFMQDPAKFWHLSEVTVLPTTFIINPEGKVVKKIEGPSTQKSLLLAIDQSKSK